MSSGTNAFGAKAGFNQSGGTYFMTLAALEATPGTAVFTNTLSAAGSNSGGAWVPPTLALANMSNVLGTGAAISFANSSALVASGKLLKDMGRTVVSAGRTFRKFAPVLSGNALSTFGVVGGAATSTNAGYGSFYLEVGRDGSALANSGAGSPAPIARYF
jgi:hypothetical protein